MKKPLLLGLTALAVILVPNQGSGQILGEDAFPPTRPVGFVELVLGAYFNENDRGPSGNLGAAVALPYLPVYWSAHLDAAESWEHSNRQYGFMTAVEHLAMNSGMRLFLGIGYRNNDYFNSPLEPVRRPNFATARFQFGFGAIRVNVGHTTKDSFIDYGQVLFGLWY
jgi:hypothetical protein